MTRLQHGPEYPSPNRGSMDRICSPTHRQHTLGTETSLHGSAHDFPFAFFLEKKCFCLFRPVFPQAVFRKNTSNDKITTLISRYNPFGLAPRHTTHLHIRRKNLQSKEKLVLAIKQTKTKSDKKFFVQQKHYAHGNIR